MDQHLTLWICASCVELLLRLIIDNQYRIKQIAIQRKDEWGDAIKERMSHAIDLPAADAMYHQAWNISFRTFRSIPRKYCPHTEVKRMSLGRPTDENRLLAFHKMLDWPENNEDEVTTISLLKRKMKEGLDLIDEPYSRTY